MAPPRSAGDGINGLDAAVDLQATLLEGSVACSACRSVPPWCSLRRLIGVPGPGLVFSWPRESHVVGSRLGTMRTVDECPRVNKIAFCKPGKVEWPGRRLGGVVS